MANQQPVDENPDRSRPKLRYGAMAPMSSPGTTSPSDASTKKPISGRVRRASGATICWCLRKWPIKPIRASSRFRRKKSRKPRPSRSGRGLGSGGDHRFAALALFPSRQPGLIWNCLRWRHETRFCETAKQDGFGRGFGPETAPLESVSSKPRFLRRPGDAAGAARDQWIERAKPTGDDLAQIRKCQRSQDRAGDYKARSRFSRRGPLVAGAHQPHRSQPHPHGLACKNRSILPVILTSPHRSPIGP